VEGLGFPTCGLGFFLFLGEGTACDAPTSGLGTVAEDVDSLKAEGVRSEELASPWEQPSYPTLAYDYQKKQKKR